MSVASASILFFCLMIVVLGALYTALYGSHRALRERFVESTLKLRLEEGLDTIEAADRPSSRVLLQWALQQLPAEKDPVAAKHLAALLMQAGFARANARAIFRLVRLFAMISGAVIGLGYGYWFRPAGTSPLLLGAGGAMAGAFVPKYYLQKRGRKRQGRITRELSDVLDLLVVCVEAGLGLFEAIKIVGEEATRHGQEIGREVQLVSGEVAAGTSLGMGLRHLAERTAVADVKPLAATLIQSEQLGAQIGPALRSSSDMMRAKRRFRAEEAAQKTTIKILFPLVLFILPAMLIAILGPAIIQTVHTLGP